MISESRRKQYRKFEILIHQYENQIKQNKSMTNYENSKLENKFLQEILDVLKSELISIAK